MSEPMPPTNDSLPEPPESVTIGMLPAKTAVSVAMHRDE